MLFVVVSNSFFCFHTFVEYFISKIFTSKYHRSFLFYFIAKKFFFLFGRYLAIVVAWLADKVVLMCVCINCILNKKLHTLSINQNYRCISGWQPSTPTLLYEHELSHRTVASSCHSQIHSYRQRILF